MKTGESSFGGKNCWTGSPPGTKGYKFRGLGKGEVPLRKAIKRPKRVILFLGQSETERYGIQKSKRDGY